MLLAALCPPVCPLCGAVGAAPCPACRAGLVPVGPVPPPPGVHACGALFRHEGAGRRLVIAAKYRNRRDALPWLGSEMARLVVTVPDLVTWAPTTPERRQRRGFDQAELLARHVARSLGRPCRGLLRRVPGAAQTGRAASARRAGVAFHAGGVPVRTVLVVDDVCTTGSTLAAAAAALRAAGATRVDAVVAAHRP